MQILTQTARNRDLRERLAPRIWVRRTKAEEAQQVVSSFEEAVDSCL